MGSIEHLSPKPFLSHNNWNISLSKPFEEIMEMKIKLGQVYLLRHDTWGKWELRNANFQLWFTSFSCHFLRGTWFGETSLLHASTFIFCLAISDFGVVHLKMMSSMFSAGKLTPQKTEAFFSGEHSALGTEQRLSLSNSSKLGHAGNLEKDKFLPLSLQL